MDLERDCRSFKLSTLVIENFPSECEFGILAGWNFLRENLLHLDGKNAQIVNTRFYPARTVIQYQQPDRQSYLRSHSLFWEKHYKPETKYVKIVPPKFCENCGTHFRPIKKN
jgi:hypothetical protein